MNKDTISSFEKSKRNSRSKNRGPQRNSYNIRTKMDKSKGRDSSSSSPTSEKIQNRMVDYVLFLDVADAFENILDTWDVTEGFQNDVVEKLTKIQKKIKKKILNIMFGEDSSAAVKSTTSKLGNLGLGKESRSASINSLCSQKSYTSVDLLNDDDLREFYQRIFCPFCLKSQPDKDNFIKHINETCKPRQDLLKMKKNKPYSVCQILPNNSYKCNICPNFVTRSLNSYFVHMNSSDHKSQFSKVSQKKTYSEFLFCSCCKVLVANSFVQIDSHIHCDQHKLKSGSTMSVSDIIKKGAECAYIKQKKFKCLVCPGFPTFNEMDEILAHFDLWKHRKNSKSGSQVYCEFCDVDTDKFEVMKHFQSTKHKTEEQKNEITVNELCFLCGFTCYSLAELYIHLKSSCDGTKKEQKKKPAGARTRSPSQNANKKPFIYIRGEADIWEVLSYFKKLGEIVSIAPDVGYVKLEFKNPSSVDQVMMIHNMIEINGNKMEVTQTPDFVAPDVGKNDSDQDTSDSSGEDNHGDDDNSSVDSTELDLGNVDEIKNLFDRVSYYLKSTASELDSGEEKEITADCALTLGCKKCSVVGFRGCSLALPLEAVSLFCQYRDSSIENDKLKLYSLTELNNYYRNIVKKNVNIIKMSTVWRKPHDVHLDGFPFYNESIHHKTQKTCLMYFQPCVMEVTKLLKECLKSGNEVIRSFCFIVRFWFSIQELKIGKLEYVVMSLLIFFLLTINVVRIEENTYPIHQALSSRSDIGRYHWLKGNSNLSDAEDLTVMELFQEFLKCLNEFDFANYAICLPLNFPVRRTNLETSSAILRFLGTEIHSAPLCIVDPNCHVNIGSDVKEADVNELQTLVRKTIHHTVSKLK